MSTGAYAASCRLFRGRGKKTGSAEKAFVTKRLTLASAAAPRPAGPALPPEPLGPLPQRRRGQIRMGTHPGDPECRPRSNGNRVYVLTSRPIRRMLDCWTQRFCRGTVAAPARRRRTALNEQPHRSVTSNKSSLLRSKNKPMNRHPKGSKARVLLSSVFGPYARDDEFGSRTINPMELYHNQVTRTQGAYSLRMFHRSWGIMMIQQNISAPCTVLDFPDRKSLRNGTGAEPLRHRGDFFDHRQRGQGAGDVPDGARALAAIRDRGRRARGRHSWAGIHD